jgi:hypothetical protein
MNENGMSGMERMWASLSPEARKARTDAMVIGRQKAKAKRERQSKLKSTPRSRPSKIDDTLELTKLAASLLELCGGSREAVNHLLDIAELVTETN